MSMKGEGRPHRRQLIRREEREQDVVRWIYWEFILEARRFGR